MVNIITVNLVSSFLEFTLFGIFAVISPVSLILLLRRHRTAHGPLYDPADNAPLWRKQLSMLWGLRRSPLIFANILLMLAVTVVRLSAFLALS